jgi:uncharacterized oxidoreductase
MRRLRSYGFVLIIFRWLGLAECGFYQRGNRVIIAGRRQQLLNEITAAHSGMHGIQIDVQDSADIEAFASRIREQFPQLNVLINNAEISKPEDLTADSIDFSVMQSTIQTNILGVLHLTALLLPTLKQQPQSTVITTTSSLAFVPISPYPTYCATKAFLHSWLQLLRVQLRETAVEVLELAPPYVQTELGGSSQAIDPAAMSLADYVAEVMQILGTPNPPHGEILVDRSKVYRFAERNGEYDRVFASRNK